MPPRDSERKKHRSRRHDSSESESGDKKKRRRERSRKDEERSRSRSADSEERKRKRRDRDKERKRDDEREERPAAGAGGDEAAGGGAPPQPATEATEPKGGSALSGDKAAAGDKAVGGAGGDAGEGGREGGEGGRSRRDGDDRPRERRDRSRERDRRDRDRDRRERRSRSRDRDRRDRDRRERSRDRGRRHDEEEPRKRRSGFSSGWDLSSNQVQTGPDVAMPLISPQLMQETRLGRRVYVGNTPVEASSDEICGYLNDAMVKIGLQKWSGPPILQVAHQGGGFAFLELRDVHEASALLLFDGMDYRGRQLKVRRPTDYQPPPQKALSLVHPPSPGTLLHSALNGLTRIKGVVSSDVPDGPNKVFLGNVPNHLTNVEVRRIAEFFGPLKGFHLLTDAADARNKGCAFLEFDDTDGLSTDEAVAGLHGLEVGGRFLTCERSYKHSEQEMGGRGRHIPQVALGTSGYGSGTAAPPALTMKPPPPPGGGYGAPSPGAGGFSPTNPMARLPGFVAGGVVPATMRPH